VYSILLQQQSLIFLSFVFPLPPPTPPKKKKKKEEKKEKYIVIDFVCCDPAGIFS
jgi:hypothetical protein